MIRKIKAYLALGVLFVALLMWWFCLPEPLFKSRYSTVLLDKDQQLLGARLANDGQWRFPEKDLIVPENFKAALILFEDKRFYDHHGIDLLALIRAMRDNVKEKRITSGGSTLTMQVMRMARGHEQRTLWQKIIEMVWATRAELRYSKEDILRLYAAHAPFGGNVVGLGAASWRYFHKTPDQLSLGEAATLAVLPNAPGIIHPGRNRDDLLTKRNKLLVALFQQGLIEETEASLAMNEPLPQAPHPLPDLAPHVLGHYLEKGETLHSTLDMDLQQRLQELLQRHADVLSLNGVNNAALMVMETETGSVRAYIGNASHHERSHQNDVDIIVSERSSGSILKPFLYCAALEDGLITPSGILEDVPTYIRGYQPLNFSREYAGMLPADVALATSQNVPMVRLLQQYGILAFKEKLQDAGITTLHYSPDHYGLPLVLGGAEVTLWDVCGAYASMGRILNHAFKNEHQYDQADVHPPVLWQNEPALHSKFSKEPVVWGAAEIYHTMEAMSTARRPDQEGQWETYSDSRRIAWKTGTSFGFRDAWAIGLTPQYTIGVWVGNADGEGRPGVIGLHAAAPVMFDVWRMLEDDGQWWDTPYHEMDQRVVCKQSGWVAGSTCVDVDTIFLSRSDQSPEVCAFHVNCFTDAQQQYRYEPSCMSGQEMLNSFFVIPARAESYYKRFNPAYISLPPLHPGCAGGVGSEQDMAIVYPRNGSRIYVPFEWDHKRSKAVFSAVHRSDTAHIYWHLDRQFIGRTKEFHQIEIDPGPGFHQLVLQDEEGSMVSARFEVLDKN